MNILTKTRKLMKALWQGCIATAASADMYGAGVQTGHIYCSDLQAKLDIASDALRKIECQAAINDGCMRSRDLEKLRIIAFDAIGAIKDEV